MDEDEKKQNAGVVRMPEPKSTERRLQDKLTATGIDEAQWKVIRVGREGRKGSVEIEATLPSAAAEKFIKLLTIKPFSPDKDTVTVGDGEVKFISDSQPKAPEKAGRLWADTERKKRSKPKTDRDPNLPA